MSLAHPMGKNVGSTSPGIRFQNRVCRHHLDFKFIWPTFLKSKGYPRLLELPRAWRINVLQLNNMLTVQQFNLDPQNKYKGTGLQYGMIAHSDLDLTHAVMSNFFILDMALYWGYSPHPVLQVSAVSTFNAIPKTKTARDPVRLVFRDGEFQVWNLWNKDKRTAFKNM